MQLGTLLPLPPQEKGVADEVVRELCLERVGKAGDFDARNVANALNTLGKLELWDASLFMALCAVGVSRSRAFEPQGNFTSLNALAKLERCVEAL